MILKSTYEATANLWRPEEEMKMGLMAIVSILAALSYTAVYAWLISPKCAKTGLLYGLFLGFGVAIGMGYGMYSVMPIPYHLAFTWFMGAWIEFTVAGLLMGLIIKESAPVEAPAPAAESSPDAAA